MEYEHEGKINMHGMAIARLPCCDIFSYSELTLHAIYLSIPINYSKYVVRYMHVLCVRTTK